MGVWGSKERDAEDFMRIATSLLLVLMLLGLSACRIGPTASDRPLEESAALGDLEVAEQEPALVDLVIEAGGMTPSAIAVPQGPVHLVIQNKAPQSRTLVLTGNEITERTAAISSGQEYTLELILEPGIYEISVTGGSGDPLRGVLTVTIPKSI